MCPYMNVLNFGTFPLGMKKTMLFPFDIQIPTPWISLHRLLENAFIHISDSGPCRNWLYSCDISVMGSMTALASNLLHSSCAVIICVARAYLGELLNCGDCRGAADSVLGYLGDGDVVGKCDGSILRAGAVVEIGGGPTFGDGVWVAGSYRCCQYFLRCFYVLHFFIPFFEQRCWRWIVECLRQVFYCLARCISGQMFWY